MAYENLTLREYFFLRERESFFIDPWTDSAVYFGDRSLAQKISDRIESDFLQKRGVPKFYVTGRYGAGKTHALAHIQHQLRTRLATMHPTEPIYVDVAPLVAKERYQRIHARLLDAVGLNRVREAAESLADAVTAADKVQAFLASGALPYGDEALRVSQANVFRNLLFGGRQMQLSWDWMKGRKTSVDEAQMLGTQKQLTEPQDFVNCLGNIGALFAKGTKRRIVFLIDEGEAVRSVTHPDSVFELRHAFRMLLDDGYPHVGFVIAIQAEGGQEAIGEIFSGDDLLRRIGYDRGIVDLNGLVQRVEDVEQFVLQTLSYLVDQESAGETIKAEKLPTAPEIFPFTEDGKGALQDYITQNVERATPSEIISVVSNSAVRAYQRREHSSARQLIDRAIVEEGAGYQ